MFVAERNGIDLTLDFGYVDVLERVENANKRFIENRKPAPEGQGSAAKIRYYANGLLAVIEEIYAPTHGVGIADKIFYDERGVNFDVIADFYSGLLHAMGDHAEAQSRRTNEMARQTAERQARIDAERAEFRELNEQNRTAIAEAENMATSQISHPEPARDTLIAYSDMGARPKVPLAAPYRSDTGGYATEGSLLAGEREARPAVARPLYDRSGEHE